MEPSIVVAIIALTGAIINAYMIKTSNSKNISALAKKTNIEADTLIFDLKNKTIIELQNQINELREEIELLKNQEALQIKEKIRLEIKLETIIQENTLLREQIFSNKHQYEEEINTLREQVKILKKDLIKYKKDSQ